MRTVSLTFLLLAFSVGSFLPGADGALSNPDGDSAVYYIGTDGSDRASGQTADQAWKTFAHAISQLQPGDSLLVLDGTFTPESTGLISVDCGADGNAQTGTADQPITVAAANERRAMLDSDGLVPGVSVSNCSYWAFDGFYIQGENTATEERGNYHMSEILRSEQITFRRNLITRSNKKGWNGNNQLLLIGYSSNILVVENEFYYHHRHAANAWKSEEVVFRRNYINPRDWRGDEFNHEALVFYQSSHGIMENNITEGWNLGFQAHGGVTYRGGPGGSYNKFLGNVAIDGHNGTRLDARLDPHPTRKPAWQNHFENYLILKSDAIGLWLSSTTGTTIENVTIVGAGTAGVGADQRGDNPCNQLPGGCSFTLVNGLLIDNDVGISSEDQTYWQVAFSNFYGNGEDIAAASASGMEEDHLNELTTVDPTYMGLDQDECIVYVPEQSNMHGAGRRGHDIGANILYRYRNGKQTDQPLWDPETGAFPHGALVQGVNDIPGESAFDVHERLNVNTNGCTLPYSD